MRMKAKSKHHLLLATAAASSALLFAAPKAHAAASNQTLDFSRGFNNAIEAVQQGLDLIFPGDLDSKSVQARLGAGFGWIPDYEGSNSFRFKVLPIVDIRYKDVWRINGNKFTYSAYNSEKFEFGPLLNVNFGRNPSANAALDGMGDIGTTLELGVFGRYKTKQMLVYLDARQAISQGQGFSANMTVGHALFQTGDFVMGAGIRMKYMSREAMQTNFGVSSMQAAATDYDIFDAKAGVSQASISTLGVYRVSDRLRLLTLVSFGRMLGSAANSPLVVGDVGSRNQFVAGSAIMLHF